MDVSELNLPDIHETDIEGVFVRDVPIRVLRELDAITNIYEKGDYMFEHIACDSEGEKLTGVDDLEKNMGTLRLKAIMKAVQGAFLAGKALTGTEPE